jgi:anti-anti-sigma regulatory factor
LTDSALKALVRELREALELRPVTVSVDLEGCGSLSVLAIHELLDADRLARRHGGRLRLLDPGTQVTRALAMAGVLRHLPVDRAAPVAPIRAGVVAPDPSDAGPDTLAS